MSHCQREVDGVLQMYLIAGDIAGYCHDECAFEVSCDVSDEQVVRGLVLAKWHIARPTDAPVSSETAQMRRWAVLHTNGHVNGFIEYHVDQALQFDTPRLWSGPLIDEIPDLLDQFGDEPVVRRWHANVAPQTLLAVTCKDVVAEWRSSGVGPFYVEW